MAITYLEKANKTPKCSTDETRAIFPDMLAKIEATKAELEVQIQEGTPET